MKMTIALSGCYDKFHKGHRHILRKAFMVSERFFYADILICMNSDQSVKALKGENRPKDNYETRASNVTKFLSRVPNDVTIQAFNTEEELLELYRTAAQKGALMIVHGNDIKDLTKITGGDEFPVLLIPRKTDENNKEISTTRIIQEEIEKEASLPW